MILNVYAMYFQTKLIISFVVSYLLLLSFLERKWTNFLISQGRFKDYLSEDHCKIYLRIILILGF